MNASGGGPRVKIPCSAITQRIFAVCLDLPFRHWTGLALPAPCSAACFSGCLGFANSTLLVTASVGGDTDQEYLPTPCHQFNESKPTVNQKANQGPKANQGQIKTYTKRKPKANQRQSKGNQKQTKYKPKANRRKPNAD